MARGAPWTPDRLVVSNHVDPAAPPRSCSCGADADHAPSFQGFWPAMARGWVQAWTGLRLAPLDVSPALHLAGLPALPTAGDLGMIQLLEAMDFWPSRGRLRFTVASALAAGSQPTGRSLPMLIPEGLGKLAENEDMPEDVAAWQEF